MKEEGTSSKKTFYNSYWLYSNIILVLLKAVADFIVQLYNVNYSLVNK